MAKKTGDYEIMPHDKIEALRHELARLKGAQRAPETQSRDVLEAMQNLTETLDHFMQLFQAAIEEMKIEEREQELIVTELQPLHEKLDQIIDQNQKIAQGIIAVADMLRKPSFSPPETPPPLFTPLGPPPSMPPPPPARKPF